MATSCLHVSRTERSRVSVSPWESTGRYYQFLPPENLCSSLGFTRSLSPPFLRYSQCQPLLLSLALLPQQQSLSHVCQSQRQLLALSPKRTASLPPSLLSVLLPHQAVALSLSVTCSLACSLSVSRPQQTVCTQTAADSGSAEQPLCLLCLSFLCFLSTSPPSFLCIGKRLSLLTLFYFFLFFLFNLTHCRG